MLRTARAFLFGLFSGRLPQPAIAADGVLAFSVRITLKGSGQVQEAWVAQTADDLDCRVDLMTGVQWIDCRPQYLALMRRRCNRQRYRVVNSFEKWGDYQFETLDVDVQMDRV